uniref:Delta(14)-sterol reductase LBR n=1 Tax=Gasterosteus aculeatus aculeatus TaxID=481459 RepID=A0AAQ4QRV1_GASAC
MPAVRYQSGEMVMGRWPGSSLYYEVKVLGFDAESSLYTVIYKDGTELELKEPDIKVVRFQTRPRSRSRSPGRRRSRSRSPARTTRRTSSRTAAAIITDAAVPSHRDTRLKDSLEVRLSPLLSSMVKGRTVILNTSSNCLSLPPGAFFWLLFLPSWVFFLVLQVNQEDPSLTNSPPLLPPPGAFWDAQAFGLVVLWIVFQAVLYTLPVGKLSEGMPLRSGERLKYRTNGFFAISVSALAIAAAAHQGVDITYIHSHFLQLTAAAFLVSVLLSVYLYVRSQYAASEQLALGGSSGNLLYDFFKGHELNPRIREFDLKFFCEMRPGLIGWCLINFAMALAEMKQQGLDAPSYSMLLVNLFQLLYVVDGLWNEEAILTTMDLMHDGFGFMLAFGDLVWVPFTYTLQAYYLVRHPVPLSPPAAAAIIALKLVGFYIFRKSNSEKNAFRRNPSDPKLSHLQSIPTATGKSLLVSGWWGVVRHPNYLGDLLMALAWSLPCGFSHLLPWYYMIYFVILLVHRDARDMSECRRKYGSVWDEYCRTVPYRIIPGVY